MPRTLLSRDSSQRPLPMLRFLIGLMRSIQHLTLGLILTWTCALSMAHGQSMTRLKTASGTGVLMNADTMFGDHDKHTIELTGNVQIAYDQYYVSCDRAIINQLTQVVEAYGNVVMTSPQTYVEGDSISVSLKDHTGVIMNGFVKSGQVIVEGAVIHKTGEYTYEADKARYTACTTCPTAWTFAGSHIRAELGAYAYIKSSSLEVAGLPVLWTPYLIVPLKSERQTGLLIPSFDYTASGGASITFPFFWAISPSQDMTLSEQVYTKRGFKELLNYRYVLAENSFGMLDTAYIHDDVFAQDSVFDQTHPIGTHANRWFLNYSDYLELPNDFYQKTKFNFMSDLRYSRDFPLEVGGQGDPALENRLSLSRNNELTHASVEVDYYTNQLKSNPVDSNRDAVHRWPELRYSLRDQRLTETGIFKDLLFNLESDYVNFAREDYAFDDVYYDTDSKGNSFKVVDPSRTKSGGGIFNPDRDVVRAGQRFYAQPELSYPFNVGAFDFIPSVNYRRTQYYFSVATDDASYNTAPYRDVVRAQIASRIRFSRIYGDPVPTAALTQTSLSNWTDPEDRGQNAPLVPPTPSTATSNVIATRYRHEFMPELTFAGTPYLNQSQTNFFGEADQVPAFQATQPLSSDDFQGKRGIQFDLEDRIINRNIGTLTFDNQLIRKTYTDSTGGAPTSAVDKLADWKLSESYDFDEAKRIPPTGQRNFPWSQISSQFDVFFKHFETSAFNEYYPYHDKWNAAARVKVMDDSARFLEVSYSQQFKITTNLDLDYEDINNRTQVVNVGAGFTQHYITFTGQIQINGRTWAPGNYYASQWNAYALIRPPGNCWGIKTTFSQVAGSDFVYHFDFDYNFGGT